MNELRLAELSDTLAFPVTFLLYTAAMVAYVFRTAYGSVARPSRVPAKRVAIVGRAGVVLALAGLATHLVSVVTRSMASGGRVPWGNMYEYSSLSALAIVALGVVVVHGRLRRPEVVGFLLVAALLTLGSGLALHTPAGPLMPILQTNWIKVHTFAAMAASSIFTVGFVFTGLYLLRDLAERRVAAAQTASASGSTVGAAYAPDQVAQDLVDDPVLDHDAASEAHDDDAVDADDAAYGLALRRAVNPWPVAIGAAAIALAYSLLFRNPIASIVATSVVGVGTVLAWWFLPALPSSSTLDLDAYRTTAFAFPIWTFAVLTGAIWAEQSWGRYWGWDPKETGAFVTWVAYAGYLHARATRGVKGRGAAAIGVLAFLMLMFTYYAVNLWIAGLHSYAGTGASRSNPPYVGIVGALAVAGIVWLVGRRSRKALSGT